MNCQKSQWTPLKYRHQKFKLFACPLLPTTPYEDKPAIRTFFFFTGSHRLSLSSPRLLSFPTLSFYLYRVYGFSSFPPPFSLLPSSFLSPYWIPPPPTMWNPKPSWKKKIIHQSIHGFCREGLHCQNPDWISSLRPTIWRFLLEPSDEWRRQNCCLRFELKQLFDKYISSVTINPSSCKFHLISVLTYNLISSFAYLYWLIFVVVVVVIWVFGSWFFFWYIEFYIMFV